MPAVDLYSPKPNMLERRFADHLAQRGAEGGALCHNAQKRILKISQITRWIIGLSALAGIVSGGLIGGAEIWMRQGVFDGMDDIGWREALPYWAAFYGFAGVISAIEITALYALALHGIARVAQHSGLPFGRGDERGLITHSLARAGLEFPNPQVHIYGIDPYAHVWNWKLTALNIAYKLKVGVSSFILRVFLRRVAARMAVRGLVPVIAGPLYAIWNAYIIWRIMLEARVRTLAPFVVDNVIAAHFEDAGQLDATEKDVILHAAGEMMTAGRDAHPNQIYLLTQLRKVLDDNRDISLDWGSMRRRLPSLDPAGQTRVLDLLTVSCVIGGRIHRAQLGLLDRVCDGCGMVLHKDRIRHLRKALQSGDDISRADLSATRSTKAASPAKA
ncbi:MAG: hypothetical protein IKD58_05130 [Loktanella sp.]|nr:hypothetical protein [Loktanella sp.]